MILLVLCVWIVVAEEITVQLHKGWNVLPVPLELESKDPKDVFGEDLNKVLIIRKYQADGVKVYDPTIPERFNTLMTAKPNTGYQLKARGEAQLNYLPTLFKKNNIRDMDKY